MPLWLHLALALPQRGSLCGGSHVEAPLPPNFACPADAKLSVHLGAAPCESAEIVGNRTVRCESTTLAKPSTTQVPILVACGAAAVQAGVFVYAEELTPVVDEAGPLAGQSGEVLHLVGRRLQGAGVTFGEAVADVRLTTDGIVQAVVPPLGAGPHQVTVRTSTGNACTSGSARLSFQAQLSVQSLAAGAGSLGGGGELALVGRGLRGANATLCGHACELVELAGEPPELHGGDKLDKLMCRPSAYETVEAGPALAVDCDLLLVGGGASVTFPKAWRYAPELTPKVAAVQALPNGHVMISGENLDPVQTPGLLRRARDQAVQVTIAKQPCSVVRHTADFVECAPAAAPTGHITVDVQGKGRAVMPTTTTAEVAPPTPPPQKPQLTLHAFTSDLCHEDAAECPAGWSCCPVAELQEAYGRCSVVCL